MQELIVYVMQVGLSGAVVGGVTNYAQGDDVLKSVTGGVAAGIATAFTTRIIGF